MKVCGNCELVFSDLLLVCGKCQSTLVKIPFSVGDLVRIWYTEDTDLLDWIEDNITASEVLKVTSIDAVGYMAWVENCEYGIDMKDLVLVEQ